jgi:hypothetical protein
VESKSAHNPTRIFETLSLKPPARHLQMLGPCPRSTAPIRPMASHSQASTLHRANTRPPHLPRQRTKGRSMARWRRPTATGRRHRVATGGHQARRGPSQSNPRESFSHRNPRPRRRGQEHTDSEEAQRRLARRSTRTRPTPSRRAIPGERSPSVNVRPRTNGERRDLGVQMCWRRGVSRSRARRAPSHLAKRPFDFARRRS